MRGKLSVGVVTALAFLIPAAPAAAQAGPTGLNAACQTVERKVYKDIRELVTVDLDTADAAELRPLGYRILDAVEGSSFPVLPPALEKALKGTNDELRAFLKTSMRSAWGVDLRISVNRTLQNAGPNVEAAGQKVLGDEGTDSFQIFLTYLNEGLYTARALDCATKPSATPSVTPTTKPGVTPSATSSATPGATTTVAPTPTSSAGASAPAGDGTSDGEGGGLAVTGSSTEAVAGIGGVLLLLGGVGYLIGRRRRSRFVA